MKTQENNIAEVKLVYKTKVKTSDRLTITTSKDAFKLIYESWDKDSIEHIEEFKIMLLNRSNKVLGIASISKGGLTGTVTDVRVILQYAIKGNANSIILFHNHPSGNLNASESDLSTTKKIKESAALMDITVLDHIIITADKKYISMADDGLL